MDKQQIDLHARILDHAHNGEDPRSQTIALQSKIPVEGPARYSAKAIQHGRHPTHAGRMERPDAYASKVGWCGEVMEMYFRLTEDRITEATFWADGCISTMACGDMLTTLAQGRTVAEATTITAEELIAALDGLPYKSHHCAELSLETLREALANRVGG
jgi:nitrogen fixation NifU-like protein